MPILPRNSALKEAGRWGISKTWVVQRKINFWISNIKASMYAGRKCTIVYNFMISVWCFCFVFFLVMRTQ